MHLITIIGVGLKRDQLTFAAAEALQSDAMVILRTERCECADWLRDNHIEYLSLDAHYEAAEDFDELHDTLVDVVFKHAADRPVVYVVPDIRDRAALAIVDRAEGVKLIPGVPVDAALWAYAHSPTKTIAAHDLEQAMPEAGEAMLVREIDTQHLASDVKLRLMDRYPAEHIIRIAKGEGAVREIQLCELDRLNDDIYAHDFSVQVPAVDDWTELERYGFNELNKIVMRLRAPDGCPWDMKQTHQSIARNAVEEAYEVVDAINADDMHALYDELGDLLLQVSLHAEIARQHGEFTIDDVTTAVCHKLISRHEHIFGGKHAETTEEVLAIWEQAKKKEKQLTTQTSAMRAVTNSLPQLMRANKVQKKAADVNFDWDNALDALAKVYEETDEVKAALQSGVGLEEELGDLLFAAVNVARLAKIEPELALKIAIDKFISRFSKMENLILADGKALSELDLTQMDHYWDRIKKESC